MSGADERSSCGHERPGDEHDEAEGTGGEDTDREEPSGYVPL